MGSESDGYITLWLKKKKSPQSFNTGFWDGWWERKNTLYCSKFLWILWTSIAESNKNVAGYYLNILIYFIFLFLFSYKQVIWLVIVLGETYHKAGESLSGLHITKA